MKIILVLIFLVVLTNLTGFSQKDNQNQDEITFIGQAGITFIDPGIFFNYYMSKKFHIILKSGMQFFYTYENKNNLHKIKNFYLSPICIELEPRYMISESVFTGIQMKYGFLNVETVEFAGFYGVIGWKKELNNIFIEIDTGAGLMIIENSNYFTLNIDLSFGLNFEKVMK